MITRNWIRLMIHSLTVNMKMLFMQMADMHLTRTVLCTISSEKKKSVL